MIFWYYSGIGRVGIQLVHTTCPWTHLLFAHVSCCVRIIHELILSVGPHILSVYAGPTISINPCIMIALHIVTNVTDARSSVIETKLLPPCTCGRVVHRQRPRDECICCLRVPCSRKNLRFYKGSRRFNLLAWVMNTSKSAMQPSFVGEPTYEPAPIRFHFRDPNLAAPLGVVMNGRFREKRHNEKGICFACQVPSWLPSAFKCIDAALCSLQAFCQALLAEHRKLWGDEGMNVGMRAIMEYSAICFNFQRLVYERPSEEARSAFRNLAKLLLPQLRCCTYPDANKFPGFVRGWLVARKNFEKGMEAVEKQYVVLMGRVRMARINLPNVWASWWQISAYKVRPVITNTRIGIFVRCVIARGSEASGIPFDDVLTMQVTSWICHFLYAPMLPNCFLLPPTGLAQLGTPWRQWHAPTKAFGQGELLVVGVLILTNHTEHNPLRYCCGLV